jgi:hypothetical protein
VNEDRNIQMELVTFGKEVEYFLKNDRIGKYLLECAIGDMSEAAEAMAETDAHDIAKMHEQQIKFRVASQVRQWLGQAISRGMEARTIIEQEEDGAS